MSPALGSRRAEASLLDQTYRQQAWWYSERTGIEDVACLLWDWAHEGPDLASPQDSPAETS